MHVILPSASETPQASNILKNDNIQNRMSYLVINLPHPFNSNTHHRTITNPDPTHSFENVWNENKI